MCVSRYDQKTTSCSPHWEMSICSFTQWLIVFDWIHYLAQTPSTITPVTVSHTCSGTRLFPQTKPMLAAHSARPTSGIVGPNAAVKKEKVINLMPRCEYSSHCLVGFNRPHLEAIVSEKGRRYLAQCHWDMWQAWPHPRACQLIQQELNALWVSGTLQSFLQQQQQNPLGSLCGFTLVSDTYGRSHWNQI